MTEQLADLIKLYHDMGWFKGQIIDWLISDWGCTRTTAQEYIREAINGH